MWERGFSSGNRRFLWGMPLFLAATAAPGQCFDAYTAGQLDHWANGAVFYQVFVRSFADSDGDGIGDFNGLTERLDYLNDGDSETHDDLDIDGIWLMPITQSPSYHGYDTVDYDHVESDYGTDEDFERFLEAAERRGIKVIIDLVVNHCSSEHPWFIQANQSKSNPYHDWFVWMDEDPGWTRPWAPANTWHRSPRLDAYYYGLFWGGMPDLNYENPEVRQEMIDIALRWLDKGVDGFRLDASRHIIEAGDPRKATGSPETHDWWREFGAAVRAKYPDALLVGENWTNIIEVSDYFGREPRTELDLSFNFDLSAAFIKSVSTGDPSHVQFAMCEVATYYPAHALDGTFLTNHDMVRVLTQLRDDRDKARLAATLLLTLPGVPFIYYGEEIGMRNGPGDEDPEKRTPMQWTRDGGFTTGKPWMVNRKADPDINVDTQAKNPDSLLNHYRHMIRLRKSHAALARGTYEPLDVSGAATGGVMAWERRHENERIFVVTNLGTSAVRDLSVAVSNADGSTAATLLPGTNETSTVSDALRISGLDAGSVKILKLVN